MVSRIRLALVRHAQRGGGDDGLSALGQTQANEVATSLHLLWANENVAILSSPKRRCIETGEAIAQRFSVSVQVAAILDECGAHETRSQLLGRAQQFLVECAAGAFSPTIIAISHSDWLEQAVSGAQGISLFLTWPPAGVHLFDLSAGNVVHTGTIR